MTTPAGWYPDGRGQMRYWSGTQWTEHVAPMPPPQGVPVPAAPARPVPSAPPPGTLDATEPLPLYKRKGLLIPAGIATVLVILAFSNDAGSPPSQPPAVAASRTSTPQPSTSTGELAATATESPETTRATTQAPPRPEPPKADGSRENPYKPGSTFTVGDWRVSLAATNTDATRIVLKENMFNSKPVAGRRFIMATAQVTYLGDEKETPQFALDFDFVGTDGREYGSGGTDDYCGVIPKSLSDVGALYPGAKASGNVCASVPSSVIKGGVWSVDESFSSADEVFVSVK